MLAKKWLGDKTKQGFYKKVRDENGKRKILALNLKTLDYTEKKKSRFETINKAKKINSLHERFHVLIEGNDKAAVFYKKMFAFMFSYVSHRVTEICDEIYEIDSAMSAGFGWQLGPFEIWDAIGVKTGIGLMKSENLDIPKWILDMNNRSFYSIENNATTYYSKNKQKYDTIPRLNKVIILKNFKSTSLIWHGTIN